MPDGCLQCLIYVGYVYLLEIYLKFQNTLGCIQCAWLIQIVCKYIQLFFTNNYYQYIVDNLNLKFLLKKVSETRFHDWGQAVLLIQLLFIRNNTLCCFFALSFCFLISKLKSTQMCRRPQKGNSGSITLNLLKELKNEQTNQMKY